MPSWGIEPHCHKEATHFGYQKTHIDYAKFGGKIKDSIEPNSKPLQQKNSTLQCPRDYSSSLFIVLIWLSTPWYHRCSLFVLVLVVVHFDANLGWQQLRKSILQGEISNFLAKELHALQNWRYVTLSYD